MNILGYYISAEIVYVLICIFTILIVLSTSFWILSKGKNSAFFNELTLRTKSWWFIAFGIAIIVTMPAIVGTILFAYISFVALREVLSIGKFRVADRAALFAAYFSIPIQYYLAYKMLYHQFLYFIPLIMFMGLAIILVLSGNTSKIGRSMSLIPSVLLLTVYMLSHIVLLYSVDIDNFSAGPGGLIIYLIILTEFNDVFQFTWGKLLGRRKILPSVSPNKTWEGFVGGVLTTAILAYLIRFLTPLSSLQAITMGLVMGIMGFIGDSLISAIKRDLRLKDTDDLIPGHGGAMDRLDSIIITAPVFYHLLRFFVL